MVICSMTSKFCADQKYVGDSQKMSNFMYLPLNEKKFADTSTQIITVKVSIHYSVLNVCPFEYTAVAVSGKVERS